MPDATQTLIQSMTIMGVSMGALIGVPPSMVEIYSTNIKKMYSANNVPLYFGIFTIVISAFIHLMIMSFIIFIAAPIIFHASAPENIPLYFFTLALFIIVSLSISCVLGLAIKNQAKLTMFSQISREARFFHSRPGGRRATAGCGPAASWAGPAS